MRGAKVATRIAFLVSGFGFSCWAPLVPLAKARLGVNDASLGLLLLCLGLGSVLAMQIAGPLINRIGARPIIIAGGLGQALLLPMLSIAPTVPVMAAVLLLFGGCLGLIDVSMNVHAIEVEKRAAVPLMSGFHALFSVGGVAGSLLLTASLSIGMAPVAGTGAAALLMVAALSGAARRLIDTPRAANAPFFVVPRGVVVLLALLAAIAFLIEGALLDWGALLLAGRHLLPIAQAGIGYSVFAVAMTAGRFGGDAVVARFGDRRVLLCGGALAVLGFAVLLLATVTIPIIAGALLGFALIGLGVANTVPVLFRQAGAQRRMPSGSAIAAVTSVGYAGVLLGPAGIGAAAQLIGLQGAFCLLALLSSAVPFSARVMTRYVPLHG